MENPSSTPDPSEIPPRSYRGRLHTFLGRFARGSIKNEESQERIPDSHGVLLEADVVVDELLEAQATKAMDWYTAFLRDVEASALPAVLADMPCLQYVPFEDIRRVVGEWREVNRGWIDAVIGSTETCRRLGCHRIKRDSLMSYCAGVPTAEESLRAMLESSLGHYRRF